MNIMITVSRNHRNENKRWLLTPAEHLVSDSIMILSIKQWIRNRIYSNKTVSLIQ